jgi:hypothetical protein
MATPEAKLENMPPLSARKPMELVHERTVPEAPSLSTLIAAQTSTTPKPQPTIPVSYETASRAAWRNGVMGALNLLAVVLAVRLVLLVAVIGALWLAKLALDVPIAMQMPALVMLGVYCATVVIPMVWLSSRK